MSVVYVTNHSDKELSASFNYVNLSFPIGKTVEISQDAARHVFGYGDNDKEPYLARLGWIRLHSELEQGLERLSKFHISTEALETNRSLPSAIGVVALHVEKRGEQKPNKRAA